MKFVLAMGLSLGVLGMAAVSSADSNEPGAFQLPVIKIVGRVMRPLATVEVNRLQPQLGVRDPERSLISKTESVLHSDPFCNRPTRLGSLAVIAAASGSRHLPRAP